MDSLEGRLLSWPWRPRFQAKMALTTMGPRISWLAATLERKCGRLRVGKDLARAPYHQYWYGPYRRKPKDAMRTDRGQSMACS